MRESHFGQQQIYLGCVSCGGSDRFLDTGGLYDPILGRESAVLHASEQLIGFGDEDRVTTPGERAPKNSFHNTVRLLQRESPLRYPPGVALSEANLPGSDGLEGSILTHWLEIT